MKKKKLLLRSIPDVSLYDFDEANEVPDECEQFEAICEHINERNTYLRHFIRTEHKPYPGNKENLGVFNAWLVLFYETK